MQTVSATTRRKLRNDKGALMGGESANKSYANANVTGRSGGATKATSLVGAVPV